MTLSVLQNYYLHQIGITPWVLRTPSPPILNHVVVMIEKTLPFSEQTLLNNLLRLIDGAPKVIFLSPEQETIATQIRLNSPRIIITDSTEWQSSIQSLINEAVILLTLPPLNTLISQPLNKRLVYHQWMQRLNQELNPA